MHGKIVHKAQFTKKPALACTQKKREDEQKMKVGGRNTMH